MQETYRQETYRQRVHVCNGRRSTVHALFSLSVVQVLWTLSFTILN